METLTQDVIATLNAGSQQGPRVTIYAPMHTTASPPHLTENEVRFKNLLRAAADQLETDGREGATELAGRLRATIDEKLADQAFWSNQTPGLLICADIDGVRLFHLPIDTQEAVFVNDHFQLAPAYALLPDMQDFYVLAIAQHQPALFKGDMYGLHESTIGLPESVTAGLHLDETNQKSEQSLSAGGSSLNTAGFNGRGGARDPGEEDRARFFRMIDKIVCEKADRGLPLILAGTDSETAEYRQLSKHPHLLKQTISGNCSSAKPQDLFERAWAIINEEILMPQREAALERFEIAKSPQNAHAAEDESAIQDAAAEGRVDTLFVPMLSYTSDTVRDTLAEVPRITFPEDQDEAKRLNELAHGVQRMSGRIMNLVADRMPGQGHVAAILRY